MLTRIGRFLRDQRGTAAIELAGAGTLLVVGLMNATDVGRYAYQAADVNHAAQAGAEAALVACDLDDTPATVNCAALQGAVTTAIQSTGLGDSVHMEGTGLSEGYYCRTAAGALAKASGANAKPSDCSAVASPEAGAAPALYLKVSVTYAFQPLFPGVTVVDSFSPNIVRTAWMRMA